MFTLEISGKAVAVIYADEENARELIDDEDFQADLRTLESGGKRIWNGTDALKVRPASPAEAEAADDGADADDDPDNDNEDAIGEEDDEDEAELVVVFIIPLDDDDDYDDDA